MYEGTLTPINKEKDTYEDNEANNDKIIVWSDKDTQDYTLDGQLIMVQALGNKIND